MSTTYRNGITTTVEAIDHPRWDWRITASHPRLATTCEDFVSGGVVIVEATERRLYAELAALLGEGRKQVSDNIMWTPAIVQGSARRATAFFIEDARGDLVDIDYLCTECAEPPADALYWPGLEWAGYGANCKRCGAEIEAPR